MRSKEIMVKGKHTSSLRIKGKGYIFEEPPGGWSGLLTESVDLISSDGNMADLLGFGVDIYNEYIILGAPTHDSSGNFSQGKVYIYE